MPLRKSRRYYRKLIEKAKGAQKLAFAPYSHYAVGAAVLSGSGKVYTGCNIESPTLISHSCAERSAIVHAISHGERVIEAVCTVSRASEPCGACRQMIREFSVGETEIISVHLDPETGKAKVLRTTIGRLLPHAHTASVLDVDLESPDGSKPSKAAA